MDQTITQSAWILPFQSPEAGVPETSLALVGGKGANLAYLAQSGFPVPDGFLLSTQAYRDFVKVNALEERIQALLPNEADANLLELASEQIRALFHEGQLPPGLAEDVADAYARLGCPPVAVRSSATAEDLPEMSFAGQQDTYLNVVGVNELLRSGREMLVQPMDCARHGLPHAQSCLANGYGAGCGGPADGREPVLRGAFHRQSLNRATDGNRDRRDIWPG